MNNLPVGKSFKAVCCTKRTTDLESFRQKRLGAVSGRERTIRPTRAIRELMPPRRRVTAESHGFKAWECVNPSPFVSWDSHQREREREREIFPSSGWLQSGRARGP